jgi:hypothetical protein
MVKGNGPWDFKVELREARIPFVTLGSKKYRFDVVANIHYGFVGAAIGFSETLLLKGAGAVQIYSKTSDLSYWNSNFDDPEDQFWIWFGIMLYHKYGDDMTAEEFEAELEQYGGEYAQN